jgi:hypothetical protein
MQERRECCTRITDHRDTRRQTTRWVILERAHDSTGFKSGGERRLLQTNIAIRILKVPTTKIFSLQRTENNLFIQRRMLMANQSLSSLSSSIELVACCGLARGKLKTEN